MNDHQKEHYVITEEDAYHIESLIELLAMAVWEILRDKRQEMAPPDEGDDFSFVQQFENETNDILFTPPF